jgi:hypothetical protein
MPMKEEYCPFSNVPAETTLFQSFIKSVGWLVGSMVLNATFNNISVILFIKSVVESSFICKMCY